MNTNGYVIGDEVECVIDEIAELPFGTEGTIVEFRPDPLYDEYDENLDLTEVEWENYDVRVSWKTAQGPVDWQMTWDEILPLNKILSDEWEDEISFA